MITVFIGQRGSGKTSLLRRMDAYCRRLQLSAHCCDLDSEIERREGRKIHEIFEAEGESSFRVLEKKYFQIILSEVSNPVTFISVGGGFDVRLLPPSVKVVWLQRVSDQAGRIFLDRPSLNPGVSPLEEYRQRYEVRHPLFREAAWEEYLIPEGLNIPSEVEAQILLENPLQVGGGLTLMPWVFTTEDRWKYFIRRRLQWGFDFFEIRDDLLSPQQIKMALRDIPQQKLLWARRAPRPDSAFSPSIVSTVDYDREYSGEIFKNESEVFSAILSIHQLKAGETLPELFQEMERLEKQGLHIKLAIPIANFQELEMCHHWQNQNPQQRSFLPRSLSGRWLWYRLWKGTSQRINFLREGDGSAPDQPSLFQWVHRKKNHSQNFAALLGDPVNHSFTPIFQGEFFDRYQIPVLPIKVTKEEYSQAIPFLESLGLIAAAVTSPLKILAFQSCQKRSPAADLFGSVNTLIKKRSGGWSGHNTDDEGLEALIAEAQKLFTIQDFSQVAVWGGGGTLPLLQKHLSSAQFYSVQSGQLREDSFESKKSPQWVIWAAGRMHDSGTVLPPATWAPQLVVDLNYRDDSGGKDLAKITGAQYLSGEIMFRVQGEFQRRFWKPLLENSAAGSEAL